MWKDLFEGIQFIFEELLFIPFELFRETQLWNWWIANGINFTFAIIGFIAPLFLRQFINRLKPKKEPIE